MRAPPRLARACGIASIACILQASTAAAQGPKDDAESHVTAGIKLREQGKDDEALAEFRRAYSIAPSPRTRAQIALAEQALGSWIAAEQDLTGALASSSDPWIAKNGKPLNDALTTIGQHLGTLDVRVTPRISTGGDVTIDGERRAGLPVEAPLRVVAGQRTLEVRAAGYYSVSRSILIAPGGMARESIELHPTQTATPASGTTVAAAPAASPATAPARGGSPAGNDAGKPGSGGSVLPTIGWVFIGTSVALIATGVVGQFVRQGNIASYNNDPTCPGQGSAAQPPACADLVNSAQTWNTVSIVSFIGGGVLASSGIVLLLVGSSSSSSSGAGAHAEGFHCGPLGCAGTF